MALLFIILSAFFSTGINILVKRSGSSDTGVFRLLYFAASCILSNGLSIPALEYFSLPVALAGAFTGTFSFILLEAVAKALNYGPIGLTYAIQNAGALIPPFLMAALFGKAYGFSVSPFLIGGSITIFLGLMNSPREGLSPRWLFLSLISSLCHGIALSMFLYRVLFFDSSVTHPLVFFHAPPESDPWYSLFYFFSPFCLHCIKLLMKPQILYKEEISAGALAGLFNGASCFFLLFASSIAQTWEKPILFPFYAVVTLFFSSFAAKKFFNEDISWVSLGCCGGGIFLSVF